MSSQLILKCTILTFAVSAAHATSNRRRLTYSDLLNRGSDAPTDVSTIKVDINQGAAPAPSPAGEGAHKLLERFPDNGNFKKIHAQERRTAYAKQFLFGSGGEAPAPQPEQRIRSDSCPGPRPHYETASAPMGISETTENPRSSRADSAASAPLQSLYDEVFNLHCQESTPLVQGSVAFFQYQIEQLLKKMQDEKQPFETYKDDFEQILKFFDQHWAEVFVAFGNLLGCDRDASDKIDWENFADYPNLVTLIHRFFIKSAEKLSQRADVTKVVAGLMVEVFDFKIKCNKQLESENKQHELQELCKILNGASKAWEGKLIPLLTGWLTDRFEDPTFQAQFKIMRGNSEQSFEENREDLQNCILTTIWGNVKTFFREMRIERRLTLPNPDEVCGAILKLHIQGLRARDYFTRWLFFTNGLKLKLANGYELYNMKFGSIAHILADIEKEALAKNVYPMFFLDLQPKHELVRVCLDCENKDPAVKTCTCCSRTGEMPIPPSVCEAA